MLERLNPIIRGWSAYYRGAVSSETFTALDDYMWKLTYKWAVYNHSNKSKYWVVNRYFGMFNRSRRDRWVFGNRASGAYLLKFSWTRIVRHQMVKGGASPDDPALAEYWAERRAKTPPPSIGRTGLRPYRRRKVAARSAEIGSCPPRNPPQTPREWEQWLATNRKTIVKITSRKDGTPDEAEPRLIHTQCHHRHTAADDNGPALLPAHEPIGLA